MQGVHGPLTGTIPPALAKEYFSAAASTLVGLIQRGHMIRLLSCGRNYVPNYFPVGRISITRSFARPCLYHSPPAAMSGFASWLKRAASGHGKSDSRTASTLASSTPQPPPKEPIKATSVETTTPVKPSVPAQPAMLRHGEFIGSLDCGTTYVFSLAACFENFTDFDTGPLVSSYSTGMRTSSRNTRLSSRSTTPSQGAHTPYHPHPRCLLIHFPQMARAQC